MARVKNPSARSLRPRRFIAEPRLHSIRPWPLTGSEGIAEQRVGVTDERRGLIHGFAVSALWLACNGFVGHPVNSLSTKTASAWLALDCDAPEDFLADLDKIADTKPLPACGGDRRGSR